MIEVDLHLHTTFSDGRLTPTELVRLCADRGLKVIAVTDHDSTEGVPEALAAAEAYPGPTVIPGIEFSTDAPGREIHMLGYYLDYKDESLQRLLSSFRDGREERARRMVERLNELGLTISWDRVQEISDGGAVGRPHIAQALVEGGYVQYPREAFDRYIGKGGPALIETGRVKLTPVEAVQTLARNGALAVMAHPTYAMSGTGPSAIEELKRTLLELKDAGLVGMEVHYGGYSTDQVRFLARLARETGLIPCGGSDYHASGNPNEPEPGSAGPPRSSLDKLRALKQKLTAAM